MNRTSPDPHQIESYLTSIRDRFEDRFAHLVEIPTVSMDPAHRGDIERGARAAAPPSSSRSAAPGRRSSRPAAIRWWSERSPLAPVRRP
jgi:hypothetical protein